MECLLEALFQCSKVDSATSSAHPRSDATGLIDTVAFQQGWEEMQSGLAEFKTIKADAYAFMHRNSRAVSGPSITRIDTVSELLRSVFESPIMVGTRVLILSRTGEKKIVAEELLLYPPAPGDTFPSQGFCYICHSLGHIPYFTDNFWGNYLSRGAHAPPLKHINRFLYVLPLFALSIACRGCAWMVGSNGYVKYLWNRCIDIWMYILCGKNCCHGLMDFPTCLLVGWMFEMLVFCRT
ncbi:uncharacterized protein LOC127245076 [Andrographis paniculata]|uniref:uncharacterized protein LOC127245076 n=1 Tax=Andrographis paniculata TaxID=175694 RepID=UPI0021E74CA5|nr:uncharacterized protein LOC127245076 [Andrographis paniculata]